MTFRFILGRGGMWVGAYYSLLIFMFVGTVLCIPDWDIFGKMAVVTGVTALPLVVDVLTELLVIFDESGQDGPDPDNW